VTAKEAGLFPCKDDNLVLTVLKPKTGTIGSIICISNVGTEGLVTFSVWILNLVAIGTILATQALDSALGDAAHDLVLQALEEDGFCRNNKRGREDGQGGEKFEHHGVVVGWNASLVIELVMTEWEDRFFWFL
jgi:hypothetical protein